MATKIIKRITILCKSEIQELYDRPIFNHLEREEYFSVNDDIQKSLNGMRKHETKVYFLLLIGYFRFKPVVPKFELKEVKKDIDYLLKTYFPGKKFVLQLSIKARVQNWSIKCYPSWGLKHSQTNHIRNY